MSAYEISTGFNGLGPPLGFVKRCSETSALLAVIDPKGTAGNFVELGHFTANEETVIAEERHGHLEWAIIDGVTETSYGDYDTQLLIQMPGFLFRAIARARHQEPKATIYGLHLPSDN